MNIHNIVREITTDNGPRMGFYTGVNSRRFRGADTVTIKQSHGTIVHPNGHTTPWPIEKMVEEGNEMVAIGPFLPHLRPVTQEDFSPQFLLVLIAGVRALKASGFPLGGFYRTAFHITADGGLLILPPALAAWTRELLPQDIIEAEWQQWTHPDLHGEEAWSFSLGVIAWTILTNADPFLGEKGEERRERIRDRVLAVQMLNKVLSDSSLKTHVCKALQGEPARRPSIDEWESMVKHWISIPAQSFQIQKKDTQRHLPSDMRERLLIRRRWLRRSGWKWAIAIAAVIVLVAILSHPVREALEVPVTAGMEPSEVAHTYYAALDQLNSQHMDDCLVRGVGRNDIRMVDTLFVTQRVRQGYEGIQEFPSAQEWLDAGRPELPAGIWPWGITGLDLRELPDGRIEAQYRFWSIAEKTTPNNSNYEGILRRDVLSFVKSRHSWEIDSIERTSQD